jgi:son of sevenless-like protein
LQISIELGNFASAMAIYSALQASSIQRLQDTWMEVDLNSWKHMHQMNDLFSMNENHSALRKRMTSAKSPTVPFLAIFLQDLLFIAEGNAATTRGLINLDRHSMAASIIASMRRMARAYPRFREAPLITKFLQNLEALSESELYTYVTVPWRGISSVTSLLGCVVSLVVRVVVVVVKVEVVKVVKGWRWLNW